MHVTLIRISIFILLGFFLAACNVATTPSKPSNKDTIALESSEYIVSIDIDESATIEALEAEYNAEIIVFEPDAGIAVLGFSQEANELSSLSLSAEANSNAFSAPVRAQGFSAWAGGWSAWAGGWSAWAGGWSAWAGGHSAWAGGTDSAMTVNNMAWEQTKIKEAHAISRNFGKGVKVAVIDSGLALGHPMFAGRLAPQSEWRDYIDNDNLPYEGGSRGDSGHGHGTAVAGVILQVAPKATILPIRVLKPDAMGDLDDVIKAIYYAVNSGAKIINISIGTDQWSASLYRALYYAKTKQVYVVTSAGNTAGKLTFPGGMAWYADTHPFVASVGSVDSNNVVSNFSAYDGYVYTFAPGEGISSAATQNQTGSFKGTSFATPIVAGALALAQGEIKGATPTGYSLIGQIYGTRDTSIRDKTLAARKFDLWNHTLNQPGIVNVEAMIRSLPGFTEPIYRIVNVHSNKCLNLAGWSNSQGANINQWDCLNNTNQQWKIESFENALIIRSVHSGQALEIAGGSHTSGANTIQWTYHGGNHQLWSLRPKGNNFEIVAKHSSKCLEVYGWSMSNGANVNQWTCYNHPNKQWKLEIIN